MRARDRHPRQAHTPPQASPPDLARLAASRSFAEFYPLYLAEHRNPMCRRLHFIGSTLALACLFLLLFTGEPEWLLAGVLLGYGFAWAGHVLFEHNRPATFKRPLYSFMGDWVMWWHMLAGKLPF